MAPSNEHKTLRRGSSMDFDFSLTEMSNQLHGIRTRNGLRTLRLTYGFNPQTIIFYIIVCLFRLISLNRYFNFNTQFSTCISSSDFELISPHVHTHVFFTDFVLISLHDFFHSKLFIDKIYLCHFTCIDILLRYLPVHCNTLINKYLGSRNTYWKSCHFNIGVIGFIFSLYYSLSIKYLKCALKYLMNYIHVFIRPCAYLLLLLVIVKLTRLIVCFMGIILFEILKFSVSFLTYLICNLRFRPRYIFNLLVLSFQELRLCNLRFRPSTFFVLIRFRPFRIFALSAFRLFSASVFDLRIYLLTYGLCNLRSWPLTFLIQIVFRPFCLFALGAFRYLFNFFNFLSLISHPNYKESYS